MLYRHPLSNHMCGVDNLWELVFRSFAIFPAATIWKDLSPRLMLSHLFGAVCKGFGNKSHSQTQVLGTKLLLPGSCVDPKSFPFSQVWDNCSPELIWVPVWPQSQSSFSVGPSLYVGPNPRGKMLPWFPLVNSYFSPCLKFCFSSRTRYSTHLSSILVPSPTSWGFLWCQVMEWLPWDRARLSYWTLMIDFCWFNSRSLNMSATTPGHVLETQGGIFLIAPVFGRGDSGI